VEYLSDGGRGAANELLPVAGGRVLLGKSKDHPLYGWDNEFGRQENDVWDFSASRYLVSNQEYLGFVEDRGLRTGAILDARGLEMGRVLPGQASAVLDRLAGGYRFRTMAQIIDMPWDWPVEVNYLEAKAFCNWLAQ
jgi:formylglycine-generating enzyme required for sulfatase activity